MSGSVGEGGEKPGSEETNVSVCEAEESGFVSGGAINIIEEEALREMKRLRKNSTHACAHKFVQIL